ncbi:hypothetical protein NQ317_000983 [Molorchus minor]|uniref:Uncharacterized protein n=1 Tax=Molorchus minor TaxID=1323400 RepID=A0ABQ9JD38_9CUCU|nr:hypothetical protein NQ317_009046 [Molorchus minor]KAJ8979699.1 hypothetical protein NQ317_000983 [Molorchus minor]
MKEVVFRLIDVHEVFDMYIYYVYKLIDPEYIFVLPLVVIFKKSRLL